ncbi:large conductance mechanosensitive channel protein MscL [Olleya aquimaris]|uniref:Large-conductance mechanosensitive channel n=1 Tax=Olleya aquimaris TaxID=639310 RepID=A0A327RL82_9FLAO|nr:large conductance mechanosensitive channel protein MscL [Olleya aquimaris]RAJ17770.1 large conductance mechanosensitive channel [Olleya aquimaris]
MLKEFKDFIMTGNVIEFAVAVIMAGALGQVINGFVNNIAMPFVGYFAGGMNFGDLHIAMDGKEYETLAAAQEAGGAVIAYGSWINSIVNLIIVGLVMFIIVKAYNKTKKPAPDAPPAGPTDNQLLMEIRDALKK